MWSHIDRPASHTPAALADLARVQAAVAIAEVADAAEGELVG